MRPIAPQLTRLVPGLYGGVVAIAASILLRTLFGTKLLAEVIVDASTQGLQPQGFSTLLDIFGASGKPLLFVSILLLEALIYLVAWQAVVDRASESMRALVAGGLAAAIKLALTAGIVAVSAAELGSDTSWPEYVFAVMFCAGTYVLAVIAYVSATESAGPLDSRRKLLQLVPLGVLGFAAMGLAVRQVAKSTGGGVQASNPPGVPTPEVTPTDKFYIVSKNIIDPVVDGKKWRLKVGGSAQRMLELTYDDIVAMPSRDQYATMQCISNEVGGDLMGNALWTGFPLRDLISRVEPLTSARYVMFRSEDDYTESLPLEFAMDEAVMLVHRMNGEPLNDKHGFPLRLLAPGKYGVKHPKWITEIALIDAEFFGYWEMRDWDQLARMNTSSRIDVPERLEVIRETTYRVHGLAFSGNRGINKVEVSTDGGATWNDATLRPPLSPYTWVLWHYDWPVDDAARNGRVTLLARATDGAGEVQTATERPPYPAGATGYPKVSVRIDLPDA